ncbi:hypothetical protein CLU79DRAFT_701316 [Phycomyces nitens]|nr:hypothetical protein CLU79DRAFT_701316 [Phycomyces nitens]
MLSLRLCAIVASFSLIAPSVHAFGQIAQVVDANNFCMFMPPADSVNRNIADTEWNAEAFCIGKAPKATNAGKLNDNFILSAHYLATDTYVQVTGQIDPVKGNLNVTDDGGQYDIKAPDGSSCAGWLFYVNLVEPTIGTYCMRCCNDSRTCNRGISEKGCAHIIPGDYSGPGISGDTTPPTTTEAAVTTTTTVAPVVTTTVNNAVPTSSPVDPITNPAPVVNSTPAANSVAVVPSKEAVSSHAASSTTPKGSSSVSENLADKSVSAQSVPESGVNAIRPAFYTAAGLVISAALLSL